MLDLKPLDISDKKWIDPIVFAEDSLSADYNFGNMFMWDDRYNQLVAPMNGRLIVKPTYDEIHFFAYPIGTGDLRPVIEAMKQDADENGIDFVLCGVAKPHIAQLEEAFPGCFEFTESRNVFDYIYPAEKMATLSGKKLHGKRNHINRFVEQNDWRFEKLTPALFTPCMDMLADWTQVNSDRLEDGVDEEHLAIERAFAHYDELGLEGGVLFSSDKIIGFTIGEKICSNGFDIHFEKAYSDIEGAYPMVSREFARQITEEHPEIQYINREDDMGLDSLRQAKLSFYPEFLVEKYRAVWKEQ
jgi:hypothetical protein